MKRMKQRALCLLMAVVTAIFSSGTTPMRANAAVTADSLQIGDYVQMGTYYDEPILWRCVDIDDNGPLMLSDKILCLKAYDVPGDSETGSHARYEGRKRGGSNYWKDSTIRCWLNSDAEAGNVEWLCGNPPSSDKIEHNAYDNEAGFLHEFTNLEKSAIKSVTQKSLLASPDKDIQGASGSELHINNPQIYSVNNGQLVYESILENYDNAYSEQVEDKIFLLDVKQMQQVFNNTPKLGLWYHIGSLSEKAVENSDDKDPGLTAGKDWPNWLRTPHCEDERCAVRSVLSSGKIYDSIASSDSTGVRPAFYMKDQTEFPSGSGTKDDPYLLTGGHAHDMSVECGSNAPIEFQKLTSKDGRLLINGKELELPGDAASVNKLPAGNYYLEEDISLNNGIDIENGDVNLCLNGHTLYFANEDCIDIYGNKGTAGSLNVCDCGSTGRIVSAVHEALLRTGVVNVGAESEFHLYGGSICSSCQDDYSSAAVCATGRTVLHKGKIVSENYSAVAFYGELLLSAAVEIKGGNDDIYMGNEDGKAIIVLSAPLEINSPLRIYSDSEVVFTDGWAANMTDKSFSDYFVSGNKGKFINKNENGELAFFEYAITEQPSPNNNYTVTANGAPDYAPVSYQWHMAQITTGFGQQLDNQTGRTLSDVPEGDYGCRVSYKDGTVVDSAIVHFIPPHTHSLTVVTAKAPSCTENGNIQYYICSGCDSWFEDDSANKEIKDKTSVVLKANGHTIGTEWKSDKDSHWNECTAAGCKEVFNRAEHEFEWKIDREATKTEKGSKHEECRVCGFKKAAVEIPPIGEPDTGNVTKDEQIGPNAPQTQLTTPLPELVEALLTDEEQTEVENGVSVKILLTVEDGSDLASDEDKTAAEAALNGLSGYKLGQYLDVNLLKIIGSSQQKITKTDRMLTVTFEIPEALRSSGRTYKVIRIHNGKSDILEDLDKDENTITIQTDKFSIYALTYSEKSGEPSDKPGEDDTEPSDEPDDKPGEDGTRPSGSQDGTTDTDSTTEISGENGNPADTDGSAEGSSNTAGSGTGDNTGSNANGPETDNTESPETGDSTDMLIWFALLAAGCLEIVRSAFFGIRKKINK